MKSVLIKNREAMRYISEIQNLERRVKNREMKKSEIILEALQQYFISLVREIVKEKGKEEMEKIVSDKELFRKHIIL